MMMRILHFVSTPATWSGVMSVIMNYYRHIDRAKVQFDFLCFQYSDDNYEQEIKTLGGNVYYVKKPGSSIHAIIELNAFFKEHMDQYQWFHNHEVYLSFYLKPLTQKYGISKFIVHSHATEYSDQWLRAKRNQLLCLPIKYMKCEKLACSSAASKFLYGEECKGNTKFLMVLHNAVDCEKYKFRLEKRESIRLELQIEDKVVIGHVGRFERQKNHRFLIDSFEHFYNFRKDAVLLLIGSGSLLNEMKQYVHDKNLDESVLFLGSRMNVWDYYQAMDQFWLPSLYEGLPMSAVEAQASGLPCLIADTVTKETGILEKTMFLKLEEGAEQWARKANEFLMENNRERATKAVRNAGFDIEQESQRLQEFYLDKG